MKYCGFKREMWFTVKEVRKKGDCVDVQILSKVAELCEVMLRQNV